MRGVRGSIKTEITLWNWILSSCQCLSSGSVAILCLQVQQITTRTSNSISPNTHWKCILWRQNNLNAMEGNIAAKWRLERKRSFLSIIAPILKWMETTMGSLVKMIPDSRNIQDRPNKALQSDKPLATRAVCRWTQRYVTLKLLNEQWWIKIIYPKCGPNHKSKSWPR